MASLFIPPVKERYMGSSYHKSISLILLLWIGIAYNNTFRMDNARTGNAYSLFSLPLSREYTASIDAPIVSSPTIVNGIIYLGARDSCVYAFSQGTLVWKHRTGHWVDASPAYRNGRIYAASRDGLVYILDAATGDSLGVIFNGSTQGSSPLIHDSLIIFGCGGWAQDIKAISIHSKQFRWHYTNRQPVYSSAAFQDSIICYGENGGALTALNFNTGALLWTYQTGGGFYLSTPAVCDSTVWVSPGTWDPNVYAVSLTNGSLLWKTPVSVLDMAEPVSRRYVKELLRFKPETRKKMLAGYERYHRMTRSQVKALDHLTEEKTEASRFVPYGGNAASSVAVGDSNVFAAHMEVGYPKMRFTLTAFDKNTGVEKWHFTEMRSCVNLGICSSPIVADSVVLFGWGEGKVYAFHARKGTKLWEDSLDGDIISSPAVENGMLYVATTTGKIVTYVPRVALVDFKKSSYCYPNPARGNVSHIQLFVTKSATAKVTIFNASEKPVLRFSKRLNAGEKYIYDWNLKDMANGVYFAKVDVKYTDGTKEKPKILKIAVLR